MMEISLRRHLLPLLLAATLHSVSVWGQGVETNVALGKPASQSSTFSGTDIYQTPPLTYTASAHLAVDGAPTKSYLDKTCAVTDWLDTPQCTDNPWWQVDLGGLYDVSRVDIYHRGQTGLAYYGPLLVRVGDHEERPENRTRYSDRPVVSVPLSPPVTASTVNISIPGCSILILCEVEVFAVKDVDECASNPCQHGGTCTDGVNSYTCTCVSGYTGDNCETDVDECASSPCQHGGTCTDGVNSYTCTCVSGYTGVNCQTDVDECASSPCQHGGTCTDVVNSYICTCVSGYTGDNCQIDVDECASSPCQHGGICTDGVNSFTCTCVSGYTGDNCETVAESSDKELGLGEALGLSSLILIIIVIVVMIIVVIFFCKRLQALAPGRSNGANVEMTAMSGAAAPRSAEVVVARRKEGEVHDMQGSENVYEKVEDLEPSATDHNMDIGGGAGHYESLDAGTRDRKCGAVVSLTHPDQRSQPGKHDISPAPGENCYQNSAVPEVAVPPV